MDSIGKIAEEMRTHDDPGDYYDLCDFVAEWASRLEAISKTAPPAPAVAEGLKQTIETMCNCIEDLANGKGGWAWEEVIQEGRDLIAAAPEPAPAVADEQESAPVVPRDRIHSYIDEVIYRLMGGLLSKQISRDDIQSAMLAAAPEREGI